VVLLRFPTLYVARETIDHEVFSEVAAERGILYVVALPGFEALPFKRRLRYFLDPIHMNDKGHAEIARELHARLAKEGLLRR
jgi:lysophospholipase L1-like esterase